MSEYRLCAVMAGTDCDAIVVETVSDFFVRISVKLKGQDRCLICRCTDKVSHGLSRIFVSVGRPCRKCVGAAVHVGIFMLIIIGKPVDHSSGALRGRLLYHPFAPVRQFPLHKLQVPH